MTAPLPTSELASSVAGQLCAAAPGSALADHAEWQSRHRNMLQQEMHTSDRFLVEIASRLGVSCSNFARAETRLQYAELRERILARLPNDQAHLSAPVGRVERNQKEQ